MKLLFWAPVLTASGYGEHSRQILRAFLDSGKFDISVIAVKWGQTPILMDDDEFTNKIRELAKKGEDEQKAKVQYDVAVQVTIPNEFKRMAPVHIGITAGIEVDRASPRWIEKANQEVDLVVVPSQHSATTFANVSYKNQEGTQELRLNRQMLVAPEGVDTSLFNDSPGRTTSPLLTDMPDFNYLSVGLGLDKNFGEDRKNFGTLIKLFCETFKDDKRVGLILKVNMVNGSLMDFEACKGRIIQIKQASGCGEFPKIKLLHGRMSRADLANLYRDTKVKVYVTLTHGEGFGLPVLEAAACGLPVIATNWSGHLDFLHTADNKKKFIPIECDLKEIPGSVVWDGVMERGTRWAVPKDDDVREKLKKVFLSYEKPLEWAKELAAYVTKEFEEKEIGRKLVTHLVPFMEKVARPRDAKEARTHIRAQLNLPPDKKTLLYTMPMSAGDVFISTGVVNSLRKKFPEHLIIFATDQKFGALLKDNPDIDKIIGFEQWMMDVPFCEGIFDEVYTPNLSVQMNTSNWVHGGKGRLLGDELAAQCGVPFGDYYVKQDDVEGLPEKYIAFHPGSGKGQHEARNYRHWKKVIHNLRKFLPGHQIVTVGQEGDIHFEGCVDFRGKTTYPQLAKVIRGAHCLVGIDSVSMHMAAAVHTDLVAIFGSSYSTSTGPVLKHEDGNVILIDTPNRMGCEKACYKHQCIVDRESPCLNEIDPREIVKAVMKLELTPPQSDSITKRINEEWEDIRPKIAGYTHVFNAETHGYPYVESITSMLGFCDEVIVVDGGSTDGTVEKIRAIGDERIKIHERKWDWTEPGMDGMQKAFGRAMATIGPDDFLWQQDADEVVSERDYPKIRKLAERFPTDVDLIHLPVVELWGFPDRVRTDRHSWKWRMSRNNFRVSHGINKDARIFDEKTGRTYAKKGMSDGCEYVDVMTGEYINHKGFYTQELEFLRRSSPEAYGRAMNKIFGELPSVFHYSWCDLERKVTNFRDFWDKCWSNLYNDPSPIPRFPNVKTSKDIRAKAAELLIQGGEHEKAVTFDLDESVTPPKIMVGWRTYAGGPLHNDEEQTGSAEEVPSLPGGVHGEGPVQADRSP